MIQTMQTEMPGLQERVAEVEIQFREREPKIHSFIPETNRFDRLHKEAGALERRYLATDGRPPLFGLLLGVKDIFRADGFPTQAGSRLPESEFSGKQASSITKLKEAGILVVGKTVSTEFAYFAPGPTRNPRNTDHTPGGSSSGSAAAVAAGLVDLALGTQTIGSIIRPASFCGVVGFKPSYGRIPADGVIPLAPSLDHIGLFSQTVEGAFRAIQVLFAEWKPSPAKEKPSLAMPTGGYLDHADQEMHDHFQATVERLRSAGYQIISLRPFKDFEPVIERHNLILAAQAAQVHAIWFDRYKILYHSRTRELIEKGRKIPDALLTHALLEARQFSLDLSTQMDINGIDAWISPAAVGAAPRGISRTGDPVMNLPWTQAGFPTIGLPSGVNNVRLPLGLQLTANFNRDEDLLAWAIDMEKILTT